MVSIHGREKTCLERGRGTIRELAARENRTVIAGEGIVYERRGPRSAPAHPSIGGTPRITRHARTGIPYQNRAKEKKEGGGEPHMLSYILDRSCRVLKERNNTQRREGRERGRRDGGGKGVRSLKRIESGKKLLAEE